VGRAEPDNVTEEVTSTLYGQRCHFT